MANPKRRILRKIKLSEISAVDFPCQDGAVMTIMKRAEPQFARGANLASDLTGVIRPERSTIMPKDDTTKVTELEGQVTDLEAQLSSIIKRLEEGGGGEGEVDLLKSVELAGQVTELTGTVDELTASLTKANEELAAIKAEAAALAKFSDEDREYYLTLTKVEDKKEYLDMEEADRKKKRKDLEKREETVVLDGRTIRKSAVGAEMFDILKSQSERIAKSEAEIAKERSKREHAEFAKRADDEYGHIPGDTDLKANMLKVISAVDDEDVRKGLETVFNTAEKLAKAGFGRLGHGPGKGGLGVGDDLVKKARQFDQLVEKVRVDGKLGHADAMRKARRDEPELYEAYQKVENEGVAN